MPKTANRCSLGLMLTVVLLCAPLGYSQTVLNSPNQTSRYAIVFNQVDPPADKSDEARRFIEIIVAKDAFSKEGLTKIFTLVSNRYPKPPVLYIEAFTDLNDIETPEERELGKTSNTHEPGPGMKDSASFTRYEKRKSFIINRENGSIEEFELK